MFKIIMALAMGGILFAGSIGAAASLGLTTTTLGSDTQNVTSCDSSVDVTYLLNSANPAKVATFRLSNIDATACNGGAITLSTNDSNVVNGTVTGATVDIACAGDCDAKDITSITVTIIK